MGGRYECRWGWKEQIALQYLSTGGSFTCPVVTYYQGQPNYFSTIQNWDTAKGRPQFEITFSSGDCQSEKVWQLSASQTVLADNSHTFSIISFRGDTCHHTLCNSIHKRHLTVVPTDSCPLWQLSPLTVVSSDSCLIWQLSNQSIYMSVVWKTKIWQLSASKL